MLVLHLYVVFHCCHLTFCPLCLSIDNSLMLKSFKSPMRELQTAVRLDNPVAVSSTINALERAVAVCRGAMNAISMATLPLEKSFAPRETKQLQWQFKKTAKAPGRKKSGQCLSILIILITAL